MSQSLLGSVIGLSKHDADARDANVRLWEDGVLQRLLDRTDPNKGAGAGLSKKGMKKMQQEARDREKRERTIARLERKVEEKEKKSLRRKEKKAARKAEKAAAEGGEVLTIQPLVDKSAIEDAKAKEAALEALAPHATAQDDDDDTSMGEGAGFVIDTTGSRSAALSDDEESDSRYLLGVPSVATASTSSRNVYTHVTDDSSASDDEHGSDGDVVLGGFGGDFVRHDGSVQASRATSTTGSSVDSNEVVEAMVVPPAKRAKKVAADEDGQAKKKKKKSSQDKANARMAFWGAKGRKKTGSDSE